MYFTLYIVNKNIKYNKYNINLTTILFISLSYKLLFIIFEKNFI